MTHDRGMQAARRTFSVTEMTDQSLKRLLCHVSKQHRRVPEIKKEPLQERLKS